ncbi:MAG: C10 family peptidase [Bacteroidales bacterium]|nr:C10 family peptidase [Bacteroidales bacterium]
MRQFFTAILCIFFTVNALAADVTKNDAARVAKNHFSEVLFFNGATHAAAISEVFDIKKDETITQYVFNFENGGYVIVSADDRFTPILGYSPDGYYEKGNMPGGFEFLMTEFSEMITFIREKDIAAKPEYIEEWERYTNGEPVLKRDVTAGSVAPMTALWNQDFPYNFYAPTEAGGPGGRAYAGCVATAMSMIMYYWRWPLQGTGTKSYKPGYCKGIEMPRQEVDFSKATYDYDGMYGTPEITADGHLYEPLALLQYHAGVAVEMQYCSDGSGTQSDKVPHAMRNFFKYHASIQHVQRSAYANTDAWSAMMKAQMDAGQPVYVSGHEPGAGSGHAFVCDGYDTNGKFHFNFGWSKSGNGYFTSDKPDVFTSGVAAVINFIPDPAQGYPANCNGNSILPYMKGMIANCSRPNNYAAGTTSTWLLDPSSLGDAVDTNYGFTIGCFEMDLAAGDSIRIYAGDNDSAPIKGTFGGKTAFSSIKITESEKIFIKFTSTTGSATGKGFLITYETRPKKYCDPDKPTTFTAASGTFTDGSPEGMNYANGTSCRWYVFPDGAVDPTTKIVFDFKHLNTEVGDVIKIYDYDKNKLVETVSGNYEPHELPQITIETKKVMITFAANAYGNDKGFEIFYSTYPVSIKEVENINDLAIYPNPANDKLNVKFNTSTTDNFDIVIYNVVGQVVYKESLNNFLGGYSNEINIANFAQGIYLMQIKSSKGATTQKVVVQ